MVFTYTTSDLTQAWLDSNANGDLTDADFTNDGIGIDVDGDGQLA